MEKLLEHLYKAALPAWQLQMLLFIIVTASTTILSTLALPSALSPVPIERFLLTSCDVYRKFHSISSETLLDPLMSMHPEFFRCDPISGLSLDFDRLDYTNSTFLLRQQPQKISNLTLKTTSTFRRLGSYLKKRPTGKNVGLSIATWFMPTNRNPERIQPILTIGNEYPVPKDFDYRTGCSGFDFRIAQFEKTVYVQYTSSDPVSSGYRCHDVRALDLTLETGNPTHVAVVFDSSSTAIYINGQVAVRGVSNHFTSMLRNWNFTKSNLLLFSASTSIDQLFHGSLHQIDLFDRSLDSSSLASLYKDGFITPAPSDVTVTARRDEINWIHQQSGDINESLSLNIGSWNESATVFQLEVELLSLPKQGILTYNASLISPNISRRFPVVDSVNSITLFYQLTESNYFNFPSMNMYGRNTPFALESFEFRIRAYDFNRTLIAVSPPVAQLIHVIQVNHPGILTGPSQAMLDAINPMEAIVPTPIEYLDTGDYDTVYVRVDLWADHGLLSLRVDGLRLAEFDKCRDRTGHGQWHCLGDGKRNRNMTFIAIPSDIRAILRYLSYHRLSPELPDQIHIQIWDGTGDLCLCPMEHLAQLQSFVTDNITFGFDHVPNVCYHQHITVEVPGYNTSEIDPLKKDEDHFGSFLGFLSIADLLFWGFVCFVVVFCVFSCRQVPRCSARGRAVDVIEENCIDDSVSTNNSVGDKDIVYL